MSEPYVFVMGPCCGCQQPFTFNPNLVPSVRIEGVRQPICQSCVTRVNPQRVANGLEPIKVLPGAYEPAPEASINWNDHD
jgi:hypothetical protein